MIIQLKNQAEKNAVLVGLWCEKLVLEYRDQPLVFPVDEMEKSLAFGTDDPITVDQLRLLTERLNSEVIICDGCEAEFTSPFDSVLCPDCSKNKASASS